MAKTAKKTTKSVKKVRSAPSIVPLPLDAKIRVIKAENPFREGTAVHKRVQAVFASKGQTVETAIKKGARRSTVRWLREHKLVTVAA